MPHPSALQDPDRLTECTTRTTIWGLAVGVQLIQRKWRYYFPSPPLFLSSSLSFFPLLFSFLPCNSFTEILFTYHKTCPFRGTVQWFLICSQCCVTITTTSFTTFSSPRKETPCPVVVTPPLAKGSHQSTSVPKYLPVQDISSAWESHTVWSFVTGLFSLNIMFSKFMHAVALSST